MPNIFIENRDRWLALSEIDYLGHFVKAWLALNAWYRSAYDEANDRIIINAIKWEPNPILNKLRPLLTNSASEEAEQFRSEIGLLHYRLQNYEIYNGKGLTKERISLENIYLRHNPPFEKTNHQQGCAYTVKRIASGEMSVEVKNRSGVAIFKYSHLRYDLSDIESHNDFLKLTASRQGFLRGLCLQAVPKLIVNLLDGAHPFIKCGACEFRCGPDYLFAGVIEALYLMRCTLFHGELVPTKDTNACYEPAYRLVRRFLDCVS